MAVPGKISPLEDFVLTEPPRGLGYRSQAKLADALCKQDKTLDRRTVGADLSKIFSFALALKDEIKNGLRGLSSGPVQKAELLRVIELHEEEHLRRRDPIKIMADRLKAASHVVYIGLEPISANLDSAPASLERLLNLSFQENVTETLSVTMGLPSREIACGIWKRISVMAEERAKTNSGQRNVTQLLALADQQITLLVLPRLLCVHTTIVFDPSKPHSIGYNWHMPWDWRSLAKMPPIVLRAWKEEYLKLIVERKLNGEALVIVPRA